MFKPPRFIRGTTRTMLPRELSADDGPRGVQRQGLVIVAGAYAPSLITFRGPFLRDVIAKGWRVLAIAATRDEIVKNELAAMGAGFGTVPISRTGMNPIADLRTALAFYRLFRRERPTVFIGYTAKPVIYGTLAAWLAGVPSRYAIITGLGLAFDDDHTWRRRLLGRVVNALYRLALKRVQRVVLQNPDDEALLRSLCVLPANVPSTVVNGSGVDTRFFTPVAVPTGATSFLMVARLLNEKGVREYVAAARAMKSRSPTTICRLAGWIDPGPGAIREADLAAWIREGAIEFLGKLTDVRGAMGECTVYVLPSYREGTPRTVLEAMALGRAIITTDVPGCRETVIDGDNGLLISARSVTALVDAMTTFVTNPMLASRMGLRSRQIAEERYDVRKVNAVLLQEMELG